MAKDKKMVEAITSMDEDFAQWYTDVVKKAELCDYASVKGCMVIKPAMRFGRRSRASWIAALRKRGYRMCICPCLSRKAFWTRKRITWRALPPRLPG